MKANELTAMSKEQLEEKVKELKSELFGLRFQLSRSKPDPDCYLKAAECLGVNANECIVFEDSFNGLRSGRAAQMKVVGLATTNSAEAIAPYSDIQIADYLSIDYSTLQRLLNE